MPYSKNFIAANKDSNLVFNLADLKNKNPGYFKYMKEQGRLEQIAFPFSKENGKFYRQVPHELSLNTAAILLGDPKNKSIETHALATLENLKNGDEKLMFSTNGCQLKEEERQIVNILGPVLFQKMV